MQFSELKREDFLYQSYYCEENIWHLCQNNQLRSSSVVFIASNSDSFPMLCQRNTDDSTNPVYWDYHVVLLALSENNKILDFDTTLPFSSDVCSYLKNSFLDNKLLDPNVIPMFKIIDSEQFVEIFSSDRSHMKVGDQWLAQPPSWHTIGDSKSNLSMFIDMTNNDIGEILSYEEILERFG